MNIALILSGGTGTRLGRDIPKQYISVKEKLIISYSYETLANHHMIDHIQIVADEKWHGLIAENCKSRKNMGFSMPGGNRQLSILNGLRDIEKYADDADYVLIHDAARPLVTKETISECLEAAIQHDGAIPVMPMKDTVYVSENGKTITSLLNRENVYAGQAPEAFVFGKYLKANLDLLPDKIYKINGSTEPAVMAGMDIAVISGDENNFKITTQKDLELFESIRRGKI